MKKIKFFILFFVLFIFFNIINVNASFSGFSSLCPEDIWNCYNWSECSENGEQTRSCTLEKDCNKNSTIPELIKSCDYIPTCTNWDYSKWSSCSYYGTRTRTVIKSYPNNCSGGEKILNEKCESTYECSEWGECSESGLQYRSCKAIDGPDQYSYLGTESRECEYKEPNPVVTKLNISKKNNIKVGDEIKIEYEGNNNIKSVYLGNIKIGIKTTYFDFENTYYDLIYKQNFLFSIPLNAISGNLILKTYANQDISAGYIEIIKKDCSIYQNSYLGYDDECYCNDSYEWNDNKTQCIKKIKKESIDLNDTDGDGVLNEQDYNPNKKSIVRKKDYSFTYNIPGENYGKLINFEIEIPEDLYLYYKYKRNHNFYFLNKDFPKTPDNFTEFVTADDIIIKQIVNKAKELYIKHNLSDIQVLWQMILAVIYKNDFNLKEEIDEYPKYPIETLYEGTGDCEDTSFLTASIFKNYLEKSVVLLHLPGHAAIGFSLDEDILNNEKSIIKIYPNDSSTKKLIFIETTLEHNYDGAIGKLGELPPNYINATYYLHLIKDDYIYKKETKSSTLPDKKENASSKNFNEDNVIEREKSLITKIDKNLLKRVRGKILLQVESEGEGWYVNPINEKKYYLGKPSDAFQIMKELGLGVSNENFDSWGEYAPKNLSGKILLKVEDKGQAYYVNPDDLKMYSLGLPSDAFNVMRNLGLGITNDDIRKIDIN